MSILLLLSEVKEIVSSWLLSTAFWRDNGKWDDNDNWND